jgi:hypothetical protein
MSARGVERDSPTFAGLAQQFRLLADLLVRRAGGEIAEAQARTLGVAALLADRCGREGDVDVRDALRLLSAARQAQAGR